MNLLCGEMEFSEKVMGGVAAVLVFGCCSLRVRDRERRLLVEPATGLWDAELGIHSMRAWGATG